jgi:NNP family nitrate/nitrite transporter-like MFS transporter
MPTRKSAHLIYLGGVTGGFVLMSLISPAWPLAGAVLAVMLCALFVTGGCGTTFALIPFVKRRITGNVAGYAGAYGNVGAVIFTTAYTFLTDNQFLLLIGGSAFATLLFCLFFLREPHGAFSHEYHLSSVDRKIMEVATPLPEAVH